MPWPWPLAEAGPQAGRTGPSSGPGGPCRAVFQGLYLFHFLPTMSRSGSGPRVLWFPRQACGRDAACTRAARLPPRGPDRPALVSSRPCSAPILAWRSAAMTTGFATLCLLGALHAMAAAQSDTGVSLSCFYCKPGQRCHHTPQTCSSPQDACIVVHERNTLGAETSGTFQACADSRRSLTGFLAFYFGLEVTVEIQSEICKSDDCNSESTPPRLAINNVPNGRECQACYAPGFQSCQPAGSLLCLGGADQCADVVGTLVQGNVTIPFAARGCATQTACSITTLESGVFTYKLTKTSCKPAPKALPSGAPRMLVWGPLSSIIPLFLPALLGPFLC